MAEGYPGESPKEGAKPIPPQGGSGTGRPTTKPLETEQELRERIAHSLISAGVSGAEIHDKIVRIAQTVMTGEK